MSVSFAGRLTPLQIEKLSKSHIYTMYDLVTCFPYRLDYIIPFSNQNPTPNQKYILNGYIQRFEIISRGRKFIKLDIAGEHQIQVYIFNTAPYILKLMNQKNEFQFIIAKKNDFWTIESFAEKKGINEHKFVLGQAKLKPHHLPKYLKNLQMTDNVFKAVHNRLLDSDYILGLEGLVPKGNPFIPQQINLRHIHHPESIEEFQKTHKQFTSLKVFLRIALLNHLNQLTKQKQGIATIIDKEYLTSVADSLPYTLSASQKTTIWDIIQDLGV